MFSLKKKLKFITINQDYLKFLHSFCSEVYYKPTGYKRKPYIGILVQENDTEYVIPLSSAKENVHLIEGKYATFSYDRNQVNEDTEIYISHYYSSPKLVKIISQLLVYYEIEQSDFIYGACSTDL